MQELVGLLRSSISSQKQLGLNNTVFSNATKFLYLRKPAPFVPIAFILPPVILITEQLALFEAPMPAP